MKILDHQDTIQPDIHSSTHEYSQRFASKSGLWFLQIQNTITTQILSDCQSDINQANTPHCLSVIDFGGGHSQNIASCLKAETDYTLQGTDSNCFDFAKQCFPDIALKTQVSSLIKLDKQSPSYDLALSYRMLPHLDDWQAHIHVLCQSSERFVAIEFPNINSINALSSRFFTLKKRIEKNTRQFKLFNIEQINNEFTKNGFQLVSANGQYILPMVLHRVLNAPIISKNLERILSYILKRDKIGSPLICLYEKK